MSFTEWHVIQQVEGKVLPHIARTVASLAFYVVEVLGVGRGNRRIFHIVNRVAEGYSTFLRCGIDVLVADRTRVTKRATARRKEDVRA